MILSSLVITVADLLKGDHKVNADKRRLYAEVKQALITITTAVTKGKLVTIKVSKIKSLE